ncbi:ferritin-like domain-containing protein [Mucilaginibacter aquaedulcis]|uniref:ferritin-like domain-containing protein n=1 Tax=Mucilaginibacter aquaedulcis TaxID=1187081 RepID=UPI0025B4467E|nr:PA2169 family four-helix-bundle protein [Mucilaginibacter aquaedulcis]MDN3551198.1 PA2169 family four-helix-bundle protein [Mucilaginibacter aquaedulcis]
MDNNIQASSLKNKDEVISDLKELLELVNDGKEGYHTASEATESPELKALFSKLSGERIVYAAELKEHITVHGGEADNESGGILGGLHRTWLSIKEKWSGNDNSSLIETIITGEKAVITKYNELIADFADHADHMELLKTQREGIQDALNTIESEKAIYGKTGE